MKVCYFNDQELGSEAINEVIAKYNFGEEAPVKLAVNIALIIDGKAYDESVMGMAGDYGIELSLEEAMKMVKAKDDMASGNTFANELLTLLEGIYDGLDGEVEER